MGKSLRMLSFIIPQGEENLESFVNEMPEHDRRRRRPRSFANVRRDTRHFKGKTAGFLVRPNPFNSLAGQHRKSRLSERIQEGREAKNKKEVHKIFGTDGHTS